MTLYGKFMYKHVTHAATYVTKHKILFYILSYTWALIPTLLGWIIWLAVWPFAKYRCKYGTMHIITIGKEWGGLELGTNCIVCDPLGLDIVKHEYGHTYQNTILGPFIIFLGWIPSVIRYHYRHIFAKRIKTKYDDFWYEGSATAIGNYIYKSEWVFADNVGYHFTNGYLDKVGKE